MPAVAVLLLSLREDENSKAKPARAGRLTSLLYSEDLRVAVLLSFSGKTEIQKAMPADRLTSLLYSDQRKRLLFS
ncbi:hypothetical protein CCACVL1_01488 [Corchorus capsularis]|uniref:Uncharacterized protein n=1 Tax=Corchorus capsularis TaxID=210143 RepID=A0A1R3KHS4_COCAP|nr:hypothetical protein CCACVL1_01488 [Corchorus capsularis]